MRLWPPRRTRSIAVLVRNIETFRPAVRPPLAMVKATEDSSEFDALGDQDHEFVGCGLHCGILRYWLCLRWPPMYAARGSSVFGRVAERIDRKSERRAGRPRDDVLSDVLRTIRLSGSLQFCFMPTGAGRRTASAVVASMAKSPASTMPFHIVVEGTCWLKMEGREIGSRAGDVVAFPSAPATSWAPAPAAAVTPVEDLPPKPWREIPILHYGEGAARVRLLCGYLQCDAMNFRPLRDALPRCCMSEPARGGRCRLASRDHPADRGRGRQAAERRALDAGAAHGNHLHRAAAA